MNLRHSVNLRYADAAVLGESLVKTSVAETYALDLEAVSSYIRTDLDQDVEEIQLLIQRADEAVERRSSRALLTSTYRSYFSFWPTLSTDTVSRVLELPRSPLVSVASVKYYDTDNVLQTIAASNYIVCTDTEPGLVFFVSDYDLPELFTRPDAIQVVFTSGYGTSPTSVPASLRQAMLLLIRHENPSGDPNSRGNKLSDHDAAMNIIDSYKVGGWSV